MKKLFGVTTLSILLSNILITPFSYADDYEENIMLENEVINEIREKFVDKNSTIDNIGNHNDDSLIVEDIKFDESIQQPRDKKDEDTEGQGTQGDGTEVGDKDDTLLTITPTTINLGTTTIYSGEETNNLEEDTIEDKKDITDTDNGLGEENKPGFVEKITETVKEIFGINESEEDDEVFESKEIYGTGEYDGVKVEVYAQTGLFESGVYLTIEPVVEEALETVKEPLQKGSKKIKHKFLANNNPINIR